MAGKKKRIRFSKIYAFKCKRARAKDAHRHIGGPGFSRVVFCNEPTSFESTSRGYANNYAKTTKYSPATFVPKSLFEQFRRVANFFFLVTAILSFTPIAPYSAASSMLPLSVVIGATMLKEGVEDFRRKQQV